MNEKTSCGALGAQPGVSGVWSKSHRLAALISIEASETQRRRGSEPPPPLRASIIPSPPLKYCRNQPIHLRLKPGCKKLCSLNNKKRGKQPHGKPVREVLESAERGSRRSYFRAPGNRENRNFKEMFGAKLEFLGETFKTDLMDVIPCSGPSTHGVENTAPLLATSALACSWSLPALALSPAAT